MDTLRKPIFFLAVALIAIAVLAEVGMMVVPLNSGAGPGVAALSGDLSKEYEKLDKEQEAEVAALGQEDKAPGIGILYMALLDAVVLFTVGLMGVSLIVPEGIHGRLQGCTSCIFSLLLILASLLLCFVGLQLVTLMVSLLLAFPFGTIAYMAIFGHFDRDAAAIVLGLIMMLKLGFAVCLLLAHQRFLQNKGLVLLVATSLLANVILSFLHGFVPSFLVSITDGIGGIIMAILAIIWAVFLLIGAIIAIVRAVIPST
ncbi:MAG: hypothetical protein M3441_19030 [Chloroflexota bacterium]|nr:hypothetical protein [Chloroflexota bacterium]